MKEKSSPNTNEYPERDDKWAGTLRAQEKGGNDIRISLTVSGGMPVKAYRFSFSMERNGRLHSTYETKAKQKTDKKERTAKTDEKEMDEMVQLLLKTRVFDFEQPPPRFVPDTVVGKLEIHAGKLHHVQYFAADEKQGAQQQMPTHPELYKVVNWIYDRASKVLDKKNLKP